MPQYDDEEDDYTEDESPRDGNDLVKQLRRKIKEQDKTLREITDRYSGLEKAHRERTVADVLAAKGINPKVAKLIPSDVEPSAEALDQWIGDYADVFNIPVGTPPAEEAASAQEVAAYDRMRTIESTAASVGADPLQQKIANAGNKEELMQLLRGGT